jgi:glycine dehydrogenase subunit 2
MTKTIFEKSQQEQHSYSLPKDDPAFLNYSPPPKFTRTKPPQLPEISEIDMTRHFAGLAKKNMGIDTNFYPLGSCTMKLNPRVNEWCASLPGFTRTHPLAADFQVQGNLKITLELIQWLCEICGMTAGSLIPNAGAQGEFSGLQMIAAYHRKRGDTKRDEVLIPDSAHGTNPATVTLAGFKTITVRSKADGDLDLDHLRSLISERTVGIMMTNPSTLGLFSPQIVEIASIVHGCGALLFYDGANLNAILNMTRPGDMGFDVMHLNLHKTFSTPHGGGGPGSGPVLCNDILKEFLPIPRVEKKDNSYITIASDPMSIGRMASFYGNFGIYLRAYLYIRLHGHYGLRRIAEQAVLNANYLKKRLGQWFTIPYAQPCMHEFVVQADNYLDKGIRATDIAKRLLDYGIHAPTVYFPLIVKECLLIEPTESESKATLDHFLDVMGKIVEEIQSDPALVKSAPHTMSVSRLDEVRAAKSQIFKNVTV